MERPLTANQIPSTSQTPQIPYYPAFSLDKRTDGITIYWFERGFSQVTYGPRPERGRNACVLIAILTAAKITNQSTKIVKMQEVPEEHTNNIIIKCFAEAILQGIEEYSKLMEQNRLHTLNLTIPEGYKALGGLCSNIHEWKSFIYVVNMAENLHNFLMEGIHAWNFKSLAKKHLLFVILIADSRAVLLVIDQILNTITFIDPHPHGSTHGACMSVANLSDIKPFCRWISKLFKDLYNSVPACFELSYFQVKSR